MILHGNTFIICKSANFLYKVCEKNLNRYSNWPCVIFRFIHVYISFFVLVRKAFEALGDNPNIAILGNDTASRLPIFSIIIYHQDSGKLVHHNFVSVLLNDLYGVQARGGCACAGPYAQVSLSKGFQPYRVSKDSVYRWCHYLLSTQATFLTYESHVNEALHSYTREGGKKGMSLWESFHGFLFP